MPCRDWSDDRTVTIENPVNLRTKEKLDIVTALLCALCTRLSASEATKLHIVSVPGLNTWWTEHQEADRLRLENEARKRRRQERIAREEILRLAKSHNLKVEIK